MNAFGKYQLIEEIGKSPTGATHRACDQLSGRIVVVKILESAGISPDAKTSLNRELTACAELHHPNIAAILDTGEINGAIYIATELLEGVDLRRHLLEPRKMPLGQKLRIMAQIYDGLAFAHQRHIAHGNIKPENIFLTGFNENRGNEGKILDFGAAKFPGQPGSVAADLFSAAAALYQFVTGVAPFETPVEPRPLRRIEAGLPEELDRLVMAALAKDPAERPQAAEIMAASLCAIAGQLPPTAEPARTVVTTLAPLAATAAAGASGAAKGMVAQPALSATASAAAQPARDVRIETGKAEPAPTALAAPIQTAAASPSTIQTAQKNADTPHKAAAKKSAVRTGIIVAAAAVLALFILAGLLSRQTSNATQSGQPVQNIPAVSIPPSAANPPAEAAPAVAVETPKAEPAATAADAILNGQVEALWESGEYAQALTLVDAILVAEPANPEAAAWKKKIRTAQQAEAALR